MDELQWGTININICMRWAVLPDIWKGWEPICY